MRGRVVLAATLAIVAAALIVVVAGRPSARRRARPAVATTTRATPTATAATTTTTTTSGPPLPARPAPGGQQFGANVNLLFNDGGYNAGQIAAQLRALRATGATMARSDALWEASEPDAPVGGVHHWDWSFDDRIASSLAAEGLTWLPILDYTAPWDQSIPGQDHSPPRSDGDYAAYGAAFAARYGAGGAFWRAHPGVPATPVTTIEIWNEPDNAEFWTPAPDAGAYAQLYLAARTAIDAVDPQARVIVGGLTAPGTFLPAMLAAVPALAGHIDGVAVHPYGSPAVVIARLRAARATLDAVGMASVPLYVTEFGWTTSPAGALDYAPPGRRPVWIKRTLATLGRLRCGQAATLLYTWVSPEQNPADSQQWFGLVGPIGAATPASEAFASGVRAATGGPPLACGT